MKVLKIIGITISLAINISFVHANTDIPPLSESDLAPQTSYSKKKAKAPPPEEKPRFKNRHAVTLDYGTWFEMLRIKNTSNNTYNKALSHYYGLGVSYDFTVYREKYGYGLTAGIINGSAQSGTENTGSYYERRVPWQGFRGGGRIFMRANQRVDLCLGIIIQSKTTQWPDEASFKVESQANPQYFYFVDTRWRLNYKTELVQAFGTHLRNQALVWRLGINYTLN